MYDKEKLDLGLQLISIGSLWAIAMTPPQLRVVMRSLGDLIRRAKDSGNPAIVRDATRDWRKARRALCAYYKENRHGC